MTTANVSNTIDKFIISLGLKDKDTKKQKINNRKATKLLAKLLKIYNIDATITKSKGIYTHENGKQVKENSIVITTYFNTYGNIFNFCQVLKKQFNQESVALEHQSVVSNLV